MRVQGIWEGWKVMWANCAHGPKTWPWWRLVWFRFLRLDIYPPSTGYRLWIYTRWAGAHYDLFFDRRKPSA